MKIAYYTRSYDNINACDRLVYLKLYYTINVRGKVDTDVLPFPLAFEYSPSQRNGVALESTLVTGLCKARLIVCWSRK
jgi:hypothetical protein